MTVLSAGARVIVTGASGFIGSNLVRRLLDSGIGVHAAIRAISDRWRLEDISRQVTFHVLDVQDMSSVARLIHELRVDAVFHLATWRPPEPDSSALAINVGGLLNILGATVRNPVPIVHFASSLEYGARSGACREDQPLAPTTTHGVSKAAAVEAGVRHARTHGLPLVILRLFHVYGPFDRPSRFIPRAISAAATGHALPLAGPGLRHDWIHVDDVVNAAILAVESGLGEGEVLNVASGRQWTNEEVVAAVERCSGRTIRIEPFGCAARPWDSDHWMADITQAKRRLGWTPSRDLDTGLTQTIRWYDSFCRTHQR